MLSRLNASRQLIASGRPASWTKNHQLAQNFISKRGSGHNNMNIEPSNWDWKYHKDMMHFYTVLSVIPVAVITTIINIRANPELTEIPEGYEPRHWEYYKHPITRWYAKYISVPMELEHEMKMACLEHESENQLITKIEHKIRKVMSFYNDHRSSYFKPFYGEYFRIGRDQTIHGIGLSDTYEGHFYDQAHDPDTPVPVEGYHPDKPVY